MALEWLNEVLTNISDGGEDQTDPQVIQLSNGNILVAWTSLFNPASGPGSGASWDLIGRIYDPLGNVVTGEIALNASITSDQQIVPAVTALEGGGFMVAYLDYNNSLQNPDWGIRAEVFSDSGSFQRSAIIETNSSTTTWNQPETASLSATSAMVAYTDGDSIFARIVNPQTGSVGSQITVANQTFNSFGGLDIAALTTNFYLVTYADRDAANDAIHFRFYNPGAGIFGTEQTVSSSFDSESAPSVAALDNGGFVIAWQIDSSAGTNTGVRAAVYNSLGINTVGAFNPMTTIAGNQIAPEVVALEGNQFLIAWIDVDTKAIRAQRFDIDGNALGTEFAMIDYGTADPDQLSLTRLEDGRFAISWARSDGSGDSDIYTAIWDSRAAPNAAPVYPDNMLIGTPGNDVVSPVPDGVDELYLAGGNDTVWLQNLTGAGLHFDGGAGIDALGQIGPGVVTLFGSTIVDFETYRFNAGGNEGLKTTFMYDGQILAFDTIDFAQGGAGKADRLIVELATLTSLNLSGLNIVDFETLHDEILINGDSSAETIIGTSVNDRINGGGGNDFLDGGGGFDTLVTSYGSGLDVTTNLQTGTTTYPVSGGGTNTITTQNFENFQGGAENNTVTGTDAHANVIHGGSGDDVIIGGDFNDRLYGELGNDRFVILSPSDIDDGVEIIDGGGGTDTIELRGGLGTRIDDLRTESITSIEEIEFGGGDGGDVDRTVRIEANQFFNGAFPLDLLIDGFGNVGDRETLEIFLTNQSVLDLTGLHFTAWGGEDELVRVIGDNSAETITGTTQRDEIIGNAGDDILDGFSGADIISGGSGNDQISDGTGNDVVDGGDGRIRWFSGSKLVACREPRGLSISPMAHFPAGRIRASSRTSRMSRAAATTTRSAEMRRTMSCAAMAARTSWSAAAEPTSSTAARATT